MPTPRKPNNPVTTIQIRFKDKERLRSLFPLAVTDAERMEKLLDRMAYPLITGSGEDIPGVVDDITELWRPKP